MYGDNNWLDQLNEMINEHLKEQQAQKKQLDSFANDSNSELNAAPTNPEAKQRQLLQAKNCMEAGTYKSVEEASLAAGYSNPDDFIDQFKKAFGKIPHEILQKPH